MQNSLDKVANGTVYGGEDHHDAKLTRKLVERIRVIHRKLPALHQYTLAGIFGVSQTNIGRILRCETWK
jgi:hypothetical protein